MWWAVFVLVNLRVIEIKKIIIEAQSFEVEGIFLVSLGETNPHTEMVKPELRIKLHAIEAVQKLLKMQIQGVKHTLNLLVV